MGGFHVAGNNQERDRHVGPTGTNLHFGPRLRVADPLKCVVRAMMMTACDLSAITKPWEVQSKVRRNATYGFVLGLSLCDRARVCVSGCLIRSSRVLGAG